MSKNDVVQKDYFNKQLTFIEVCAGAGGLSKGFIDCGFEFVRKFILKAWKKNLDKSGVTVLDSKTKLQEYSLKKFKKLPIYKLVDSTGPKHNPVYKISVSIVTSKTFVGTGHSTQEAEQNGASKLLKNQNIE